MRFEVSSNEKLILLLLKYAGGRIEGRVRLMKLVFLTLKECPEAARRFGVSFNFRPYLHGPFSMEVLKALDSLQAKGLIRVDTRVFDEIWFRYEYELTGRGFKAVEDWDDECIKSLVERYGKKELRELLRYVYRTYPRESTPTLSDILRELEQPIIS
ncbi:MAG: hypothetical protein DRK00_10865 [Thermoprotei archaeon]|nr:MAG: hypothetical protein DRK00_10865 [Thermoprotei archaeon]